MYQLVREEQDHAGNFFATALLMLLLHSKQRGEDGEGARKEHKGDFDFGFIHSFSFITSFHPRCGLSSLPITERQPWR